MPGAPTLLLNGDFEAGLADWATSGSSYGLYTYGGSTFVDANGGVILASFGGGGTAQTGTIAQGPMTGYVGSYTLSFDWCVQSQVDNNLQISWNDTVVYDGLAQYSATNTLVPVSFLVTGTGSDTLTFLGWSNSVHAIGIDNVTLTAYVAPAPIAGITNGGATQCSGITNGGATQCLGILNH